MGRALEGRLEWRDTAGERIGEHTFPSRTGDCGELARAMGFALALQIQLMATTTAEPPSARRRPRRPSHTGGAPTRSRRVRAGDRDRPPRRTDAFRAFDYGGGRRCGGIRCRVRRRPARAPVRNGRVAARRGRARRRGQRSVGDASGRRERILSAPAPGTLAGCGVRRPWSACLVAKLGRDSGGRTGHRLSRRPPRAAGPGWPSSCRDAHAGRRFEIAAHADGLVLLTQGTVTLDSMPVWTTPRFVALVGADVGVRFR